MTGPEGVRGPVQGHQRGAAGGGQVGQAGVVAQGPGRPPEPGRRLLQGGPAAEVHAAGRRRPGTEGGFGGRAQHRDLEALGPGQPGDGGVVRPGLGRPEGAGHQADVGSGGGRHPDPRVVVGERQRAQAGPAQPEDRQVAVQEGAPGLPERGRMGVQEPGQVLPHADALGHPGQEGGQDRTQALGEVDGAGGMVPAEDPGQLQGARPAQVRHHRVGERRGRHQAHRGRRSPDHQGPHPGLPQQPEDGQVHDRVAHHPGEADPGGVPGDRHSHGAIASRNRPAAS